MGRTKSAIVIGGGVVGVAGAYALARDGWHVRLLDRFPAIGQGASLGNGRQLSYSHTNALASPRILSQIPRLALGCDDAFRINLRFDIYFWNWIGQFLGNCRSSKNLRNTLEGLTLAEQSRQAMESLLQRHPIAFDRRTTGKIVLLRGQKEIIAAKRAAESKRAHGVNQQFLSLEQAIEIEPALAHCGDPFDGAIFTASDESGDCSKFADELMKVTCAEYGAQSITGMEAIRIERRSDRSVVTLENNQEIDADLVVVSGGHQSNKLLAPLGLRLPIEPMKGYSFIAPAGKSAPVASVTDNKRRIVFTNLGDRMLIAGIAEIGQVDNQIQQARLESMIDAARASLPDAAIYAEADNAWTGMRPMTPNSLPITKILDEGIAANTGHGMLGWTMAMGSGERLCEAVRETV